MSRARGISSSDSDDGFPGKGSNKTITRVTKAYVGRSDYEDSDYDEYSESDHPVQVPKTIKKIISDSDSPYSDDDTTLNKIIGKNKKNISSSSSDDENTAIFDCVGAAVIDIRSEFARKMDNLEEANKNQVESESTRSNSDTDDLETTPISKNSQKPEAPIQYIKPQFQVKQTTIEKPVNSSELEEDKPEIKEMAVSESDEENSNTNEEQKPQIPPHFESAVIQEYDSYYTDEYYSDEEPPKPEESDAYSLASDSDVPVEQETFIPEEEAKKAEEEKKRQEELQLEEIRRKQMEIKEKEEKKKLEAAKKEEEKKRKEEEKKKKQEEEAKRREEQRKKKEVNKKIESKKNEYKQCKHDDKGNQKDIKNHPNKYDDINNPKQKGHPAKHPVETTREAKKKRVEKFKPETKAELKARIEKKRQEKLERLANTIPQKVGVPSKLQVKIDESRMESNKKLPTPEELMKLAGLSKPDQSNDKKQNKSKPWPNKDLSNKDSKYHRMIEEVRKAPHRRLD